MMMMINQSINQFVGIIYIGDNIHSLLNSLYFFCYSYSSFVVLVLVLVLVVAAASKHNLQHFLYMMNRFGFVFARHHYNKLNTNNKTSQLYTFFCRETIDSNNKNQQLIFFN